MSKTNQNKPKGFSFLILAEDFELSTAMSKIPQQISTQQIPKLGGFLYEYTDTDIEMFSIGWGTQNETQRIETVTYFLLFNAAIEGEI